MNRFTAARIRQLDEINRQKATRIGGLCDDINGLKGNAVARHATSSRGFGRWTYCKYCYKNVRPVPDYVECVVVCDSCGAAMDLINWRKSEWQQH